jgi:hypothetical protein
VGCALGTFSLGPLHLTRVLGGLAARREKPVRPVPACLRDRVGSMLPDLSGMKTQDHVVLQDPGLDELFGNLVFVGGDGLSATPCLVRRCGALETETGLQSGTGTQG